MDELPDISLPGGFDPGRLFASFAISPDPEGKSTDDSAQGRLIDDTPTAYFAWCLLAFWLIPVLLYYLWDQRRKETTRTIERGDEDVDEDNAPLEPSCSVMLASIEHSTPWTEGERTQKVQAGGLGVVVRLIAQHHPVGAQQLWLVHPMVAGPDYGQGQEEPDVEVVVDGRKERVGVVSYEYKRKEGAVTFLMLKHQLFTERGWKAQPPEIYPNPMTKTKVLCFYALWNGAVGALMRRHQPDVYHCADFHCAIAPWHAVSTHPKLKVLLVLHNAEYQGSISTEMALGEKARRMAAIFGVSYEFFVKHLVHDGRLNMLKAAVDFCAERQNGKGVRAVSQHYAEEVEQLYDIFWSLPAGGVKGLPNPMLEEERAKVPLKKATGGAESLPPEARERLREGESPEISVEDLPKEVCEGLSGDFVWLHEHLEKMKEVKTAAKGKMQRLMGLQEDASARLFVSLGRIVRQKGVDLIAEVAQWLLEGYSDAQLVVIGPDEDGFGAFARARLEVLQQRFKGRMFCYFAFWRVPTALKLAADFCLMPSRDEPFGYVDVEFAWNGALVVGAQAGGLGKVPGFYYVAQNRENLKRLFSELRTVLAQAMAASEEKLANMARNAVLCSFPLDLWQRRLLRSYEELLAMPQPPQAERRQPARSAEGTELFPCNMDAPQRPLADEAAVNTWDNDSWIMQELSELELKDRIVRHLSDHVGEGADDKRRERIDEILEVVATEEDCKREKLRAEAQEGHWLGEWLLGRFWGVHRIHWVVASGFIFLPAGQLLAWVVATEMAVRSAGLPNWVPRFSGPVDPTAVSLTLFMANALPQAFCGLLWARLCSKYRPKVLLAWAILLNLALLIPFIITPQPNFIAACALMAFAGVVASASMLFVVFNFMMSIRADVSQAALRMGRLEIARSFLQWSLQAYVLFAAPSSQLGTKEQRLPYRVMATIIPLGLLIFVASLVPGVLVLFAPRPYRDDRFPSWNLGMLLRKPSFLLLMIADCLEGLAAYPSSCYVSWWLANGHSLLSLGAVSITVAVVFSVSIGLWARALSKASVHGFSLLVAVVIFMAPPSLLRAVAMEEVSTLNFLRSSKSALFLSALTVLLEGVRSSALWAAKIRILGSRWRLLSWGCFSIALQQACTFVSPLLCEAIARVRNNSSLITRNQKELADAMIVSIVPLGCLQYVIQLLAIMFIHRDLGLAPLRGPRRFPKFVARLPHCLRQQFAKGAPAAVASTLGVIMALCTVYSTMVITEQPLPYNPVKRCTGLTSSWDHFETPCAVLQELENPVEFGVNEYGQATSARQRCHQRMRNTGGDTFFLELGKSCQILQCETEEALRARAWPPGADVFSQHCSIYGQNLVAVHLFEWSWSDIAQECTDYLGPAGFDAVQVSPPTEHILGPYWYTRYQPVSYKLDSRSGTEEEFKHMVAECRKAGVSIMVDAVINHMAGPYPLWPENLVGKECDGQGEKYAECKGWSGTQFGSRLFSHGDVHYSREEFHHFQGDPRSNCVIPPFYNNRHLCDLSALPDLDTEQFSVQHKLQDYLGKLYAIGVTMFRIDAAMCMYPASLGQLLQNLPLDYVYQEYYADLFQLEKFTMADALEISPVSDFDFGWTLGDILFDYKKDGKWVSAEERFQEILEMGAPLGTHPDGVLPPSRGLQFLDNHDQQRERWKPEHLARGDVPMPFCEWDGKNVKPCRPIYKQGALYNLAQLFLLIWPRGDSAMLMSSFAWKAFKSGPPGTSVDALRGGEPEAVWRDGAPSGCRATPTTSPVTDVYDNDTEQPWVCEHRWEGVAGLVRMRKLFEAGDKERAELKEPYAEGPVAAFSLDDVAFFAMHRGYNEQTKQGSEEKASLKGVQTTLPPGEYCDMARETRPVPSVKRGEVLLRHCENFVVVDASGAVARGSLEPGRVLALHWSYRAGQPEEEADVDVIL